MIKKQPINPFWGAGEKKDFGKVAIEYAAGKDVVLDQQLIQYECLVNQAHVLMLLKQKLISKKVAQKLLKGLEKIKSLDKKGKFKLKKELEDVHSNIEQYLIKKLGIEVGGYLRLGIARNDQVYTDTIMYMKNGILEICQSLLEIIDKLSKLAGKHLTTIMPGYTHLRISQPITFAHWLMAKAYHLLDDVESLLIILDQINKCPLGIVEMSGTHLPLDRKLMADLLGFDKPTENSLYTANQRGENEAKVLAQLSLLALHIRRAIQEIIIFSSTEFGFFEINDLYVTGGTAQPNLKNPDTLEVIRANCAKVYARFLETLITMDSLPSGYNRDTQQTKPALLETVEIIETTLPVFTGIMTSLNLNKEKMAKVAETNFAVAPDVSVQIAIKSGVSFREAYKVVKVLIREGILKKNFSQLTPKLLSKIAKKVLGKSINLSQKDINEVSNAKNCVLSHVSEGGPAPSEVKKMIKDVQEKINKLKKKITQKQIKTKKAIQLLENKVNGFIKGGDSK